MREPIKSVLASLQRPARATGATILIYHRVGGGTTDELDIGTPAFERHLDLLASHKILSLDAALDRLDVGDQAERRPDVRRRFRRHLPQRVAAASGAVNAVHDLPRVCVHGPDAALGGLDCQGCVRAGIDLGAAGRDGRLRAVHRRKPHAPPCAPGGTVSGRTGRLQRRNRIATRSASEAFHLPLGLWCPPPSLLRAFPQRTTTILSATGGHRPDAPETRSVRRTDLTSFRPLISNLLPERTYPVRPHHQGLRRRQPARLRRPRCSVTARRMSKLARRAASAILARSASSLASCTSTQPALIIVGWCQQTMLPASPVPAPRPPWSHTGSPSANAP